MRWTSLVFVASWIFTLGCESGKDVGPGASIAAAASGKARDEGQARPGPEWNDGARYAYTFSLSSGAEVSGQKSMEFALTSEAVLDVRRLAGEELEFAGSLTGARFVAKDPDNQPEFDALAKELAAPFAFKLREGVLVETRLPTDTTAFAASIRRTLASLLQFAPEPAAANGGVWTAKETDPTGTYEAEYRRGENGTISKRKLRYDERPLGQTRLGNFASMLPKVAQSSGTWVLAQAPATASEPARLRLERLEATEKVVNPLTAGASISSETTAKLALLRQSRPEPAFSWEIALASTRIFLPNEQVGPKTPTASYDSLRIGSYTFASALSELEKQGQDPKTNDLYDKVRGQPGNPQEVGEREGRLKSQAKVFTAMVAILRSQPVHIAAVLARIRARSTAARPLIDALSSAGTEAAQRALVQLTNDKLAPPGVRRTAAFALTRTASPTQETIDALTRGVDDELLRVYAVYGLGTLGRHLAEAGDTERADAITQVLIKALKTASTASRRVDVLRGIANSGADSAFSAVQPYLEGSDTKVRVAAVDAIRLMRRPEVDPILANALDNGPNEVRLAAIEAASVRTPSSVVAKSLESLASTTDRPGLRLKLVRVMGGWLKARPELKAPLQQFAQSDASEEVRLAAQNALGT